MLFIKRLFSQIIKLATIKSVGFSPTEKHKIHRRTRFTEWRFIFASLLLSGFLVLGISVGAQMLNSPDENFNTKLTKTFGQDKTNQKGFENFDIRVNGQQNFGRIGEISSLDDSKAAIGRKAEEQNLSIKKAVDRLKNRVPGAEVSISALTSAVETVRSADALTEVNPGRSGFDIVRQFIGDNAQLYGLKNGEIGSLHFIGESVSAESGLRMVRVEQTVNQYAIFQSETRFILDRDGRIIQSLGLFVPQASSNASRLDNVISAQEALRLTAEQIGIALDVSRMSVGDNSDRSKLLLEANDEQITGDVTSKVVYFPVAPGVLIPAWSQIIFTPDADYYVLVDARNGTLLWRKNIRNSASTHDARFRVYVQADGVTPADNPAPQSPNTVAPGSGTQFPEITPVIVSMLAAMDATASPNGWINDCPAGGCTTNETQTLGNNALVCMDAVAGANANICDTSAAFVLDGNGRPTGNPDANGRNRDFLGTSPRDFQTNYLPPPQGGNPEAGQTATGNGNNGTLPVDQFRRGALTHLFYVTNWYHDKLYRLGFDEAAGNFQQTNFSGMGLGNDRVLGDAQDSSGTNNANFATPPDGISGRMQMFRFTGPTIDRDGGLDTEVVIHELTHGISNRLIGNAAGLSWDAGRGMGEGWSDFYALSLLNSTNTDNPNGRYPSGAYATYKLSGLAFLDNYVYGIRRFPYSTVNNVNPLTWADVDDVTNNLGGGIAPTTVNFNDAGAFEVHNVGELWANTLWEVRSRIIADPTGANGDVPTGNQKTLQIVTDGMKLTPINPSFSEARDAIINADCATNACANEQSIWDGFADRGLGYKSVSSVKYGGRYVKSHSGLGESFLSPNLDNQTVTVDDSAGNNNGAIDPNEPIKVTVNLRNPWRGASKNVSSASATLTSSTAGISITDGSSAYGAIPAQGSANGDTFAFTVSNSVFCGQAINLTMTITSNLGTVSRDFTLRVGTAAGTDPVVTYTRTSSPALTITNNAPRGVVSSMNITDDLEIADVNFRIDSATHPSVGDLTFMLRGPNGYGTDFIALIDGLNDLGGTSIVNMVIDDDLPAVSTNDMVQATSANAPYTKGWLPVYNSPWAALVDPTRPGDPVGELNPYNGLSTKGTWTALAADVFAASAGGTDGNGTFNGWSLLVTPRAFTCAAYVNSAPTLNDPADQVIQANAGAQTVNLTGISTGGNAGQSLTVTATSNNPALIPNPTVNYTSPNSTGTLTYTPIANASGTATITVTVTDNGGTEGGGVNTVTQMFTVTVNNAADLSVTVTDTPDPVTVGSNLTYTITVTNAGPSNAATATLSDVLPAGTTFVSLSPLAGWNCTTPAVGAEGTVSCSNPSLAAGSSVFTLTVKVSPNAVGGTTISNTATVSSATTDPNNANNSATATTAVVSPAVVSGTKTVSGTYAVGSTATYTIVLSNSGAGAQQDNPGNEFVDQLPAGLTLVSASSTSGTTVATVATRTVTFNGTIPAGGSVTITITATVNNGTEGQTISNQGTISYDADGNGTNEVIAVTDDPTVAGNNNPTVFVAIAVADLSITKTASANPTAGANLTYTITVTNSGPSTAASVTLADTLPAGTTFVSGTQPSGWNCTTPAVGSGGTVTCTRASFALGSAVFTIVVRIAANLAEGATLSNTATVSSTTGDPNSANNTATITTPVGTAADLSLTMTGSNPVVAGGSVTYTLRVNNTGPSDAQNVVLLDQIPSGTTYQSVSFPAGWKCRAPAVGTRGSVRCTRVTLAADDQAVFALRVRVNPTTAAGTTIFNQATVTTETTDPNGSNDSSSSTVTVSGGGSGTRAADVGLLGAPTSFFAWLFKGGELSQ